MYACMQSVCLSVAYSKLCMWIENIKIFNLNYCLDSLQWKLLDKHNEENVNDLNNFRNVFMINVRIL